MSDNIQPTNGREQLRKEAEEQAKQEDAITWGAFEGKEPTPEKMRAAKEVLEKRQEGTGSAIVFNLPGGQRLEAGDPELLRWLKEAMRYKPHRVRDNDSGTV